MTQIGTLVFSANLLKRHTFALSPSDALGRFSGPRSNPELW